MQKLGIDPFQGQVPFGHLNEVLPGLDLEGFLQPESFVWFQIFLFFFPLPTLEGKELKGVSLVVFKLNYVFVPDNTPLGVRFPETPMHRVEVPVVGKRGLVELKCGLVAVSAGYSKVDLFQLRLQL